MPEGDTLFRIAATLQRALAGEVVTGFEAQMSGLDAAVVGRTVDKIESRGKHLLIHFSGGLSMRSHLRMNGSWHIYRVGERWKKPRASMRVAISTARYVAVGFDLPVAELLTGAELAREPTLNALGPDLLSPSFDRNEALRRLRARTGTIAEALLDQRALAGIGNVYKSELLFLARIHPHTQVARVSDEALDQLVDSAHALLARNATSLRGGRWTTRSTRRGSELWVYGRGGRPCRRCGAILSSGRDPQLSRITTWCNVCQVLAPA